MLCFTYIVCFHLGPQLEDACINVGIIEQIVKPLFILFYRNYPKIIIILLY